MTGTGPHEGSEGTILPRVIGNSYLVLSWETGFFTYVREWVNRFLPGFLFRRPKTLLRLPLLEPEVQTQWRDLRKLCKHILGALNNMKKYWVKKECPNVNGIFTHGDIAWPPECSYSFSGSGELNLFCVLQAFIINMHLLKNLGTAKQPGLMEKRDPCRTGSHSQN